MQWEMGSARALACGFRRLAENFSRGTSIVGEVAAVLPGLSGGGAGQSTRGACAPHLVPANCIVPA